MFDVKYLKKRHDAQPFVCGKSIQTERVRRGIKTSYEKYISHTIRLFHQSVRKKEFPGHARTHYEKKFVAVVIAIEIIQSEVTDSIDTWRRRVICAIDWRRPSTANVSLPPCGD